MRWLKSLNYIPFLMCFIGQHGTTRCTPLRNFSHRCWANQGVALEEIGGSPWLRHWMFVETTDTKPKRKHETSAIKIRQIRARPTFAYSVTVPNLAAVETHPSQYPKEVEWNSFTVPICVALHLQRTNNDPVVSFTRGLSQVVRTIERSQIPLDCQYIYWHNV